jgi:transcriptional regulator with PAS, ATPase and Fis domain
MLTKIMSNGMWQGIEDKGIGLIGVNNSYKIMKMSRSLEVELGLGPEEGLGKSIFDFLSEDSFEKGSSKKGYTNLWREAKIRLDKGKSYKWAIAQLPVRLDNGKVVGSIFALEKIPYYVNEVASATKQSIELIGISSNFLHILDSANLVAKTNSTVLLRGESGTGKDLMAKHIHFLSDRRDKPFIPINCAALPPTLMESELFGYVEGAFTGARKGGKIGLLEAADQGTVVFDEVTELSPFMQVKFLRFLQEGTIRRIGDIEEKKLNVRVIASTNRDIEKMVGCGEFREDLYYRLNVFPIFIPPLRDRKEDIPLLAKHFICKLNPRLHTKVETVSEKALQRLQVYSWPGNIRELEYILERAMIVVKGKEIRKKDIIIDKFIGIKYTKYKELYLQKGYALKQILAAAEEDIIREALKENQSIRMAARSLGISHSALIAKMNKLHITTGVCIKEHYKDAW